MRDDDSISAGVDGGGDECFTSMPEGKVLGITSVTVNSDIAHKESGLGYA